MADFAQTYTAPAGSPQFYYDVSYTQTSRSSGSATYSVTVTARMKDSGSYFGYYLDATVYINNVSQTIRMKENSPAWSGTGGHSFTFTLSPTGLSDSGGTTTARLVVTSNSSSAGKIDTGGDETVTCSAWNTAPYWPANSSVSLSVGDKFTENTSSIGISWTAASDNENNTKYYTVKRYVNGSYNYTVVSNTTSTSVTDDIGVGNQGTDYSYSVEVNDGSLWASNTIWSGIVTKNYLTAATISTSATIYYTSSSYSMTFNYSGASNTNGNGTFAYSLACDKVTLKNPTKFTGTVKVYTTDPLNTTECYMLFADVKTATSSTKYNGTFTYTLTTTNGYGSSKTNTCTQSVDIRTAPTGLSSVASSGTYQIPATTGPLYYVPNRKAISLTWTAATDPLGTAITYDVYANLGGKGYTTVVKTGLTTNSTSFNLGAVSSRTSCIFKVVAKTNYDYTSESLSPSITLDYYDPPTIIFNGVTRNLTSATVSGSVILNTSIPNVTISSSTYVGKAGTSQSLTVTSGSFNQLDPTTLTDSDTYTFTVTVQDIAGVVIGTSASPLGIVVPKYSPMLSVRELGVGVNTVPDGSAKFIVNGDSKFLGPIIVDVDISKLSTTNFNIGNKFEMVTGGNVTAFNAVYMSSSGIQHATGTGDDTLPTIGIALSTVSLGGTVAVLTNGIIRNTGWAFTKGALVYLSTSLGGITTTKPTSTGNRIQIIGIALDTNLLYVNPQYVWVTV